jgi:hypothetical protein
MKRKELNTVFVTISVLLLVFGLLYGLFWFNRGKNNNKNSNSNEITNDDKKDKDVKYEVTEVNIDTPVYEVLGNKYLEKANSDGTFTYSDLNNKDYIKNVDRLKLGIDNKLYEVKYDDNTLTISFLNKNTLIPSYSVLKESNFMSNVYYLEDDTLYLLGVVLEDDDVDYLYYINSDNTIKEIKLEKYHFLGDIYYDETDFIVTSDKRYIVVSSSGHNDSTNTKVYDLVDEKFLFDKKYDDIVSIGDSMFIVSNDNKSTIINAAGKSLTIPCDFIDRIGDYYLMIRDKKMAVLDNNKKAISDFEIPYYGNGQSYHTLFNNNYIGHVYNGKLIVETVDLVGKEQGSIYYINKDNKLKKINDTGLYIGGFLHTYSSSNNTLNVYSDSFELLHIINLNDYFEGIPYYELSVIKNGTTLIISKNDTNYFLDFETGEKVDSVRDYQITFTDSIKIKVHNLLSEGENKNVFTLFVKDKEYKDYNYSNPNFNGVFRKINDKYYIFGENKYAVISKG